MSVDPWHEVKNEVQNSLETAETLRASFLRIQSTASSNSEELNWARNELKGTLAALDADLEDLEESVRIVEESGGRLFGVEEEEVMARRKYVVHVRKQIELMRKEVNATTASALFSAQNFERIPPTVDLEPREDDQAEWARLEQEMEVQRQDTTLDTISGTLHTLAAQAGLIGQEVGEHNELLTELESQVDRSDSKLTSAMKKMKHFIRETEVVTRNLSHYGSQFEVSANPRMATSVDRVRAVLVGSVTPSFIGVTLISGYLALSLRPTFIPVVFLLSVLVVYTRATINRPNFLHRFFALLSALCVAMVAGFSSSTRSAMSTKHLASGLLLFAAAVFSLVSLAPILIYAKARKHVGSQSTVAGILLFPALWTTTWSVFVYISPLGRLGTWTPMTGVEMYSWVLPIFGQAGMDYITALWAVVVAEYAGEWAMGAPAEDLLPAEADPNVETLIPITHEVPLTRSGSPGSPQKVVSQRYNPTHYLLGLLFVAMLPFYEAPILPLPAHSANTTELTVGCIHPYIKSAGAAPTLEDYIYETTVQASRSAKILLWPEGAAFFRTEAERLQVFEVVANLSTKQRVWIGVGYEQSFTDGGERSHGKRVRGHNGLAIFGPGAAPVTYVKRKLVPLVESFSYETSLDPPPKYLVSLPKPNYRPKSDKTWPRTIPITAAICLDVSAPLAAAVPVNHTDEQFGRPALILAPARTWHPDIGKAMFQHASMRAFEQGASVLWCDGGEGGVSGVGGLAASGLGPVGGIGQVGTGGSWIQNIAIPFPYGAKEFAPTWYYRWGDLSIVFLAWIVLGVGFTAPVFRRFESLVDAGRNKIRASREGSDQTGPNEHTSLLH